jgi:hypothetical protein
MSQIRKIKIDRKVQEKNIYRNFPQKFFLVVLELLIFYLILGLNLHIHLFFSSPFVLVGSKSRIFKFGTKKTFFPSFLSFPLELGCFFKQN